VEESIAATLRFPGGRVATFVASFGAESVEGYRVTGSKGDVDVNPSYTFQPALRYRLTAGGTVTEKTFPAYDHFSGQAAYFSDCILNGERPEPDGEEGLADVRAMLAIEKAAATGTAQAISSPPRPRHPALEMARAFPQTTKRLLV
jgi:predicted dehydrogenase